MSSFVTAQLAVLVASMRAGGARVGVGDLLTAHRALAVVDASNRAQSFLALRTALCKQRSDLDVFGAAFDATFGAADAEKREAVELPEAATLVVPRVGVPPAPRRPPGARRPRPPAGLRRGTRARRVERGGTAARA